MTTPHKHAELIKAWADGAVIEMQCSEYVWTHITDPSWYPEVNYRVKPIPDPLKEFKDAFAAGKGVQWRRDAHDNWKDVPSTCAWVSYYQYQFTPIPHKWQHLIDAQAAGKKCQRLREDGTWANGYWDFDSQKSKYRLKPETLKFRNYLWESTLTGNSYVHAVMEQEDTKSPRPDWNGFIQWVGDWQEVELPST